MIKITSTVPIPSLFLQHIVCSQLFIFLLIVNLSFFHQIPKPENAGSIIMISTITNIIPIGASSFVPASSPRRFRHCRLSVNALSHSSFNRLVNAVFPFFRFWVSKAHSLVYSCTPVRRPKFSYTLLSEIPAFSSLQE